MINKLYKMDVEHLEELIDKSSLKEVLCALVVIATEKATHIRETWQDDGMAKLWDKDAKKLEAFVLKIEN